MLARLSVAFVVSIALISPQTVGASPITFDFTGALGPNVQPVDGSRQFSGSFTINGDPTVNPGSYAVSEGGSDVSITLNVGGQVINFVNSPQSPNTSANFYVTQVTLQEKTGPVLEDEFLVSGVTPSGSSTLYFNFSFFSPATDNQLGNLRNFSLPLDSSSVNLEVSSGTFQGPLGTITSIQLVSAPEPSMLAVFAVLGIAAMAHGRRRES
jgi:hypothetical protein